MTFSYVFRDIKFRVGVTLNNFVSRLISTDCVDGVFSLSVQVLAVVVQYLIRSIPVNLDLAVAVIKEVAHSSVFPDYLAFFISQEGSI